MKYLSLCTCMREVSCGIMSVWLSAQPMASYINVAMCEMAMAVTMAVKSVHGSSAQWPMCG